MINEEKGAEAETYLPLPVEGLHLTHARRRGMLVHRLPQSTPRGEFNIDEDSWAKARERAHNHNAQVFEDSLTKLPAETYRKYIIALDKHKFMQFKGGEGNLLVHDDVCGNLFWVNDVGQLVSELRRVVNREVLKKVVVEVREEYLLEWGKQLDAFADTPLPTNKRYAVETNSRLVEQYDNQMRLMYIFPCEHAAGEMHDCQANNIRDAATRKRPMRNMWFRYFYDNSFIAAEYKYVQVLNGRPVNRFKSVKEASRHLRMPEYAIYRALREGNIIDRFGCKWYKIDNEEQCPWLSN